MPRLRRSNQGVTPEGLHGGSTSGANLIQDPASSIQNRLGGRVENKKARPKPRLCEIYEPGAYSPGGFLNSWIASLLPSSSAMTFLVA